MTLAEIAAMVSGVDPEARHYYATAPPRDYTYWEETRQLPLMADDVHAEEGWRFYVHRFTRAEEDPVTASLKAAFEADPRVAFSHTVDNEKDSEYIHHIFECEAV